MKPVTVNPITELLKLPLTLSVFEEIDVHVAVKSINELHDSPTIPKYVSIEICKNPGTRLNCEN